MNNNDFDDWIFRVCEIIGEQTGKTAHDIYPTIDLTDAKLQYLDGVLPKDFCY